LKDIVCPMVGGGLGRLERTKGKKSPNKKNKAEQKKLGGLQGKKKCCVGKKTAQWRKSKKPKEKPSKGDKKKKRIRHP